MPSLPDHRYSSFESFGKYRFLAEIGFGGMSEIYLAVTQGGLGGFQKLAVVKLLRRDLAEDDEFRRMFLDEARLAARLSHPNVVQTYDVGDDHGRYYIAMEYLEGQTFERIRRARGGDRLFPLHMQIEMVSGVLSGLHYAHALPDYDGRSLSVVHRDVTPSNVLVTYDGQVKLLDFGIAKILESSPHTRVGVLKGKARYMAPEQITGGGIDRRTDLYSVGVMLWEILAGRPLWAGLPENEILRRSGEVPPLPPDTHVTLHQICARAMARLPADRYPTAEALRDDLDLYLAQNATPTRERDLGAAVAELFAEERTRIRRLVESQLKGPPTDRLPAFREARTSPSSHSRFDVAAPPHGHDAPSPAQMPGTSSNPQLVYSGENLPQPAAFAGPGRRRAYLIAVSALVVAVVALLAVIREHQSRSPGDAPASAAAHVVAPSEHPPRSTPLVVRGITSDTITLGMSAPFSGTSRELGSRMKLGIETAFAQVNDAGGVAGRALKLIALDDGHETLRALGNVQDLVGRRGVFAVIGNVGNPTAKDVLPFMVSNKVILFGSMTGSQVLRRDPPDRYVFNYRASYEEEASKIIHYLVNVKKLSERNIAVFTQNDSYGDAVFEAATKTLRKFGHDDAILRVSYERNTVNVEDALARLVDYHTSGRGTSDPPRPRHPVKAIIMVASHKAAARFIQKVRDKRLDALLLNVSFVGSNLLSEELMGLGAGYARGVIVTQVVPHYESEATGVMHYRDALKKYHPDQQPDFASLEGYIVGQLFAEGLRRAGRDVDTEALIDALEHVSGFDLGIGGALGFGPSEHQASHRVWGTELDAYGAFHPFEME